jgi:hypothetical protein
MLDEAGIESVKLPPRSPNLNAYAERFVRTIKEGCLDQMIFFGEDVLRRAVHQFVIHYHEERNHQGLDNRLITPISTVNLAGTFKQRQRLGGLLKHADRMEMMDTRPVAILHSTRSQGAAADLELSEGARCRERQILN